MTDSCEHGNGGSDFIVVRKFVNELVFGEYSLAIEGSLCNNLFWKHNESVMTHPIYSLRLFAKGVVKREINYVVDTDGIKVDRKCRWLEGSSYCSFCGPVKPVETDATSLTQMILIER